MRKFILLASLLAINCTRQPMANDPPTLPPSPLLIVPSQPAIKNLKVISINNVYEAFGIIDYSRQNVYTYYYRRGTSHLNGGNPVYREYNSVTKNWSDPVTITTDTRDGSVFGGRMDNDSTVLFVGRSNNGMNGDWSLDIQIIKCDSNNRFQLQKSLIGLEFRGSRDKHFMAMW